MSIEEKVDEFKKERLFVKGVLSRIEMNRKDTVELFVGNNLPYLSRLSEEGKKGNMGADSLWRSLPEIAQNFYSGLNYLNQGKK